MGLMKWLRRQLIDIIEWTDQSRATLVWRFPHDDNEIKNGAQLVVREGQIALLVHEGQLGDVFKPGLYTLTTQNIPVLTSLESWKYGFESPFKCEVYFVSTLQYLEMKWGTVKPILLRDADFGLVRLRAFGVYTVRVDPDRVDVLFRDLVGTDGHFSRAELEGQLRALLLDAFTTVLARAQIPVLDMPARQDELAEQCRVAMAPAFAAFGLQLPSFLIQSLSLPDEVEKAIDERSSMGAVGDLGHYTRYQAAKALGEAAKQPGGAGLAAGLGLGAGAAMGQLVAQQMSFFKPDRPVASASMGDRLRALKQLHADGLIDDDAFTAKRDTILAEL